MKLIKINTDHYIIVDNSEIKEGDYKYCPMDDINKIHQQSGEYYDTNEFKITHSTRPLEYLDNSQSFGFKMKHMSSDIELIYDKIKPIDIFEVKELLGELDVEQYAWDNPILSRKDVYELFNDIFKDRKIEGAYQISASKQVYEFNERLRKLAKQKAIEDNKEKKYTFQDLVDSYEQGFADYIQGLNCNAEKSIKTSSFFIKNRKQTEWEVEIINNKLKLK